MLGASSQAAGVTPPPEPSPHVPPSYKTQQHEARRAALAEQSAFPPGGAGEGSARANHKQGHVCTVHGDPFILPVTQAQLRWGGHSSCERRRSSALGSGWACRWVPAWEEARDPRLQTDTPRKGLSARSLIGSTHTCQARAWALTKSWLKKVIEVVRKCTGHGVSPESAQSGWKNEKRGMVAGKGKGSLKEV